jgi:alpha-glucosidase (family GH31 glycosyl hydrolase)
MVGGFSLALVVALSKCTSALQAPYASWAHSHFVWLVSGESNQANTTALVDGYQQRNITVGAVDLDSGWSTGFNNFVVDQRKFADLGSLISDLHSRGIYTILWATSMIDTDSTNYAEG